MNKHKHEQILRAISTMVVTFSEADISKFFYNATIDGKKLTVVAFVSELYEISFELEEKVSTLLESYECEVYFDGKEVIL